MKKILIALTVIAMAFTSCKQSETVDATQAVLDNIAARTSVRAYTSEPVPDEMVETLLRAAMAAPSAMNRQPWEFIIIDTPELCQGVIKSYDREWVKTAPTFIIACGNHDEAWHRASDGKDHTDVDLSIAIEHICLAATDAGLGTCWICNFDRETLIKALNIPESFEPIAIIPIGYPMDSAPAKNRKEIDQIIKWGSF